MKHTGAAPRVLLVSSRADLGGGPEHVLQLLRGLSPHCELHVACPREAPYWQRFAATVGERNMLPIASRKLSLQDALVLRRFARAHRIDILHSHGHGAGVLVRLCAPAGIRLMHTHHGLHFAEHSSGARRFVLTRLQRALERRTDLTVFVSEDEQRTAWAAGLARSAWVVIPNGVEVLPEAPSVVPAADGRLRVATVSRFNAQKNPEGLLAVLGALARRQGVAERIAVSVYGDGEVEARAAFAAHVDARGLRAMVSLRGAVPDLRAELRRHDVFFSCSRWEGLPLSVLEAMALGLPAVLSEVDGHRDILANGSHGVFGYPLSEPARAAEALEGLMDPEFRARSGVSARLCVAVRYSRETMLQQTLAAYENLLSTSVRETIA